ncbi:E3 ubiquitin-protein ligase TRIM71-like [Glandiceps talaboti]
MYAKCVDCDLNICENCQGKHLMILATANHRIFTLDEYASNAQDLSLLQQSMFCDLHQQSRLESYCNHCAKPICDECSKEEHNSPPHHRVSLSSVSEKYKKLLSKGEGGRLQVSLREGFDKCRVEVAKEIEILEKVEVRTKKLMSDINHLKEYGNAAQIAFALPVRGHDATQIIETNVHFAPTLDISQFIPKELDFEGKFGTIEQDNVQAKSLLVNSNLVPVKVRELAYADISLLKCVSEEEKLLIFRNLHAHIQVPNGSLLKATIVSNTSSDDKASYTVKFKCLASGRHMLSIKLGKAEICQSPISIDVVSPWRLVGTLGETGNEPAQFQTPHGVAVDKTGHIIVADSGNRRVQSIDSRRGNHKDFPIQGTKQEHRLWPKHYTKCYIFAYENVCICSKYLVAYPTIQTYAHVC